ncbi:MAG: hypothetical protein RMH77_01270 [Sulfolobales archaeon]|nr:50S ribosomal protein L35ae [Sulfolobales archaeon]MCX8186246.1 50S ribosomal protein L35ae [Sulfolobales archaeon]MDW7969018.1 hypothetical protein [Sulfolobales archaeon]
MVEHTADTAQGIVLNYRVGKVKQLTNYLLVKVTSNKNPNVDSLIGYKVLIKDLGGNIYRGRVVKIHSRRNNVVVVRMKRNVPGQLLGADLTIFK